MLACAEYWKPSPPNVNPEPSVQAECTGFIVGYQISRLVPGDSLGMWGSAFAHFGSMKPLHVRI